jgi:signal transduction histidine kinase
MSISMGTPQKVMIEQLLFLARGDNNTMKLQMERFELSELADEVFKETKMFDAGHTYEFQSAPVFVFADEALVKQAMRILIDNAMKYTPPGGAIRISSAKKEETAVFTVQDEGIGISPEALPRIFDRFYRADESRARSTGGTGLGLSIAKWITERHGGHMEVLSREGIGTRISILIPAPGTVISKV